MRWSDLAAMPLGELGTYLADLLSGAEEADEDFIDLWHVVLTTAGVVQTRA